MTLRREGFASIASVSSALESPRVAAGAEASDGDVAGHGSVRIRVVA
jgi:hypothetical protein